MVVIGPGEFLMGRDGGEAGRYEGPVHKVKIDNAFAIGLYEVTNGEYGEFVDATGHASGTDCRTFDGETLDARPGLSWADPGYGRDILPDEAVACVNWNDATAYAAWLKSETGQPYRLLSEAEWEYAARAGRPNTEYTWGDDKDAACRTANVYDQSGATADIPRFGEPVACDDGQVGIAPVGSREANPFGVYDMIGNVWEWVGDCYVMTYMDDQTDGTAQTNYGCDRRGVRGGSWGTSISRQRAEFRGRDPVELTTQIFGFRIARDLP
jgi:formylglycine-generating enzyme required for sulfatase activity